MADGVAGVFNNLAEHVDLSRLTGVNATLQFEITGEGGGNWCVVVTNGVPATNAVKCEAADLTVLCSAVDWMQIVSGEMSVQTAFITGRLKVRGDMTLAMKLQGLFGA